MERDCAGCHAMISVSQRRDARYCSNSCRLRAWHRRKRQGPRGDVDEDAFWAKVSQASPTDCWEWTGYVTSDGYGTFWDGTRTVCAHRLAYEFRVGPIPEGLQIDHLCRNRRCMNPEHLEPVTQRENLLRGIEYRRRKATSGLA